MRRYTFVSRRVENQFLSLQALSLLFFVQALAVPALPSALWAATMRMCATQPPNLLGMPTPERQCGSTNLIKTMFLDDCDMRDHEKSYRYLLSFEHSTDTIDSESLLLFCEFVVNKQVVTQIHTTFTRTSAASLPATTTPAMRQRARRASRSPTISSALCSTSRAPRCHLQPTARPPLTARPVPVFVSRLIRSLSFQIYPK